ncbi:hypothetical protein JCM11641_000600 [Rhodosporidiobolus odoratus]
MRGSEVENALARRATRTTYRALGILPADPSIYPTERTPRRHLPPPPSEDSVTQLDSSPDLPTSFSDSEPEDENPETETPIHRKNRTRTLPPAMSSFPTSSLGKPPLLLDLSPESISDFLLAFDLYFDIKNTQDDRRKILMVGLSLGGFVELSACWSGSRAAHSGKTYSQFVEDFKKEAFPRDFVWEVEREIRESRQREKDYGTWAAGLRNQQQAIGVAAMDDFSFVRTLLFNMDGELSTYLRQHPILSTTGLHEDDLAAIGLRSATATTTTSATAAATQPVISARKADVAREVAAASRKSSSTPTASRTSATSTATTPAGQSPMPVPRNANVQPGSAALTPVERAYLDATYGCTRCRKSWQDHRAGSCTAPIARERVNVPSTFKIGNTVTPPAGFQPTTNLFTPRTTVPSSTTAQPPTTGFRALAIEGDDDDTEREQEWFLGESESEVRQGELRLANGTFDAGEMVLKVAELEEPYDVILGNPFLYRHRLTLSLHPYPQLIRPSSVDGPELDLYAPIYGPPTLLHALPSLPPARRERIQQASVLARLAVLEEEEAGRVRREEEEREREELKKELMEEFRDRFPDGLPRVSEADKSDVRHRIRLKDPQKVHNLRGYPSPARWNERWKRLLDKHVDAGRLRLSSSPFASPSFVQPKKDPMADPRWLNDYRHLNSNTVPDCTPLPIPDEILSTSASKSLWGKIDMSDAFFQTLMTEEDIEKTAIKTPWGLYEWVVMPQGLCNAPATHQRRINEALGSLNGTICFAFVDDIIIFSDSIDEHRANCRLVLDALRSAGLYCSPKKTDLATIDTEFLGHRISRAGIGADPNKVKRIAEWTTPRTAKEVRGFLGLVQYLRKFIKALAGYTVVLTPLTRKGMGNIEALWGEKEERAFQGIKNTVTSLPVLRPVDHSDGADPIWIMADASKVGVGAILLQGKDWKEALPCGFYSRQFIPAEKNYPTHEQELLAIVAASKAWRIELLGEQFTVLSDHETLKHLSTQPDLSKRQARWLEKLADYHYDLKYLPGQKNTIADGLSRYSFPREEDEAAVAVMGISTSSLSKSFVDRLKSGYEADGIGQGGDSSLFEERAGLFYVAGTDRLLVPTDGMGKAVRKYCASCDSCQRHKSSTQKRQGAHHALPVPVKLFADVAMDFVGPLPKSGGKDMLLTVTDRLSGYTRLLTCMSTDSAKEIASVFFDGWVRLFGPPERIVSDRDKLFTSRFWRSLHKRMGSKLQMSTAFHPETDGCSERTNKTAVQVLRTMVSWRQTDWGSHLSSTEYAINSVQNVSTGKAPFELVLGFLPRLNPLPTEPLSGVLTVEEMLADRAAKLQEAQDTLWGAKVQQGVQTNAKRGTEDVYAVDDLVLLNSRDRRRRFKATGDKNKRSAKFFPRWDGPYRITAAFPSQSLYQLQLDPDDASFNKFHVSKLKRYSPNDAADFPLRQPPRPDPVVVGGEEEYTVESIVDERTRRGKSEYLCKAYPLQAEGEADCRAGGWM